MPRVTKINIILLNQLRKAQQVKRDNEILSSKTNFPQQQSDIVNFYKNFNVSQDILRNLYPHLFELEVVEEEVPVEVQAETPVEVPVEVQSETPVETPVEVPVETPVEVPVEVQADDSTIDEEE